MLWPVSQWALQPFKGVSSGNNNIKSWLGLGVLFIHKMKAFLVSSPHVFSRLWRYNVGGSIAIGYLAII